MPPKSKKDGKNPKQRGNQRTHSTSRGSSSPKGQKLWDPQNFNKGSDGTADSLQVRIKRQVGEGYVGQSIFHMLEDSTKRQRLTKFLEVEAPDVYKNGYDFEKKRGEPNSLKDVLKLFQSAIGSDKSKSEAAIVNSDKMQKVLDELSDLRQRFSPTRKPSSQASSSSSSSSGSSSISSGSSSSSSSSSSSAASLRGKVSPSKRIPSPSSLARAWNQGLLTYSDVCLSAQNFDLDLNSILQSASALKSATSNPRTPDFQKRKSSPGSTLLNTSEKGADSTGDASSVGGVPSTGGKSAASSYFVDDDAQSPDGASDSDSPTKLDPKKLNLFGKASLDKAAIKHVLSREGFLRKDGGFKQSSIKAWYDAHGGTILAMNYDIPPFPQRGSEDANSAWGVLADFACRIIIFEDDELRESISRSFKETPKSKARNEKGKGKASMSSIVTTLEFDADDTPSSVPKGNPRVDKTKGTPAGRKILSRRRPKGSASESDSAANDSVRGRNRGKKQRVCSLGLAADRRVGRTPIPTANAFDSLGDSDSDADEDLPPTGTVSGKRE